MQESLSLYRELGYVSGMIEILKQLGAIELRQGRFDAAHTWLDEALSLLQQHAASLGNSKTVSYDVGDLAYYEGNYEVAQQYYDDCLAWAERVVSSVSIGYAKARLGFLSLRCGELHKAAPFFQEALQLFRKTGNLYGINFALEGFAGLAAAKGRWKTAAILYSYAERQSQGLRPPVERAELERGLASVREQLMDEEYINLSEEGRRMTMDQAIALVREE